MRLHKGDVIRSSSSTSTCFVSSVKRQTGNGMLRTPISSNYRALHQPRQSMFLMASSAATASLALIPSISEAKYSRLWQRKWFRGNAWRSRACASVAIGSRASAADSLFADYKPTNAFLFPGQVVYFSVHFCFFSFLGEFIAYAYCLHAK